MKIGILSDTHNVLRESVLERLKGCEMILHAGDVGEEALLECLEAIAPTYCVRGNNDKKEWTDRLPEEFYGTIGNINYYMVHDKKDIPKNLTGIELVIYGHSHKYDERYVDGVHYLNPGSCGRRRFSLPLSMVIARVQDKDIKIELIDIE